MRKMLIIAVLMGLTGVSARAQDAVPAASYFPILPTDAADDAMPQLIPVASNHGLEVTHPGITRAIIVIHDETRNANDALASMSLLAGNANAGVMIVAPQFLLPSDVARVAPHLPEHGRVFATWQAGDWPQGGDSLTPPPGKPISSFTVIDLMLMYLSDRKAFPDMQTIAIAGFGAGGNFVQRYAAFNAAASVVDKQSVNLRYVVASATSYLYVTANRPLGGRKGFGRPDVTSCPDYNAYPYGLDKLAPYARRVGVNAAKTDYATRFITYLTSEDPDAYPDAHCGALVQGADSNARTANFHAYLLSLYGDVTTHTQTFSVPQGARNDAVSLYGSACGMAALFGDGLCMTAWGGTQ